MREQFSQVIYWKPPIGRIGELCPFEIFSNLYAKGWRGAYLRLGRIDNGSVTHYQLTSLAGADDCQAYTTEWLLGR